MKFNFRLLQSDPIMAAGMSMFCAGVLLSMLCFITVTNLSRGTEKSAKLEECQQKLQEVQEKLQRCPKPRRRR